MAVTHNILLPVLLFLSVCCFASSKVKKCEKIKIPMCQGIGYNLTYMPNMFNHDTQEEAALEIHQFWPLVEIKCSPDLKFFLCSMYAPMCKPNFKEEVPPCLSICKRARNGCAPLMRQYGFSWPTRMRCRNFPKDGDGRLCLGINETAFNYRSTTARPTEITLIASVTTKAKSLAITSSVLGGPTVEIPGFYFLSSAAIFSIGRIPLTLQ